MRDGGLLQRSRPALVARVEADDIGRALELQAGIAALEALPAFEGSMLYTMEFETIMTYLRTLGLVVEDGRMDNASVKEEVRKVIEKVQPASAVAEDDAEQQAIEKAKAVAFDTCLRVLDALETSK